MRRLKVHRIDPSVHCPMSDKFDDVEDCETCQNNVTNKSDKDTIYCDYGCNELDEREITISPEQTYTITIKGGKY